MPIMRVLVVMLVLAPLAVYGHARLIDSEPGAESILDAGPDRIVLQFSEPVQPVSLRLIDSDGIDRAKGLEPQAIDASIVVELGKTLAPGRYLVSYRVLSTDAHPIAASFEFSVREGAAGDSVVGPVVPTLRTDFASDAPPARSWDVPVIASRAAFMFSLLLAAGGALFLQLVPSPALQQLMRQSLMGLGMVGVLAALAYLQLSGAGMLGSEALPDMAAIAVAAESSLGLSLGLSAAGLLLLVVTGARRGRWLVASVVLMIAGRVFTGHPVSREPGWLLVPAMGLHVTAAAFWYGSLVPLMFALARLPVRDAASVVHNFSRLAVYLVGCLALAGLLMALIHLASPVALLATWYGQLLLMKTTWFAVLLGFATWHKLRLAPQLEAGNESVARRLRLSIGAEMVVMTLVVLISVNLASTSPEALPPTATTAGTAYQALDVKSLQGNYIVRVNPAGLSNTPRQFSLAVQRADGVSVQPLEISVSVAVRSLGVEPLEAVTEQTGEGVYRVAPGIDLPGEWEISVEALITDFDQEKFVFCLQVE